MDARLRLVTILGARPQFIKGSALSRRIARMNSEGASILENVVHSGQHYDIEMSDVFFEELSIPRPAMKLPVDHGSRGHRFGTMISGLEQYLQQDRPDVVVVFGDTDTTLAGALAANQLGIPVAHVEAGLRSFNRSMPEETNRILTDHISLFLFCPTKQAVENLRNEGLGPERAGLVKPHPPMVSMVGDIQLEALRYHAGKPSEDTDMAQWIKTTLHGRDFFLATLHRAENTTHRDRLAQAAAALERASSIRPVVFPMHPGTQNNMERFGLKFSDPNVIILPPVGFLSMIQLLKGCSLVLTDSGGLQKEAFFMRKPCVTLREETEWVELVENGFNLIAGLEPDRVAEAVTAMLKREYDWNVPLYGKGDTSRLVLESFGRFIKT